MHSQCSQGTGLPTTWYSYWLLDLINLRIALKATRSVGFPLDDCDHVDRRIGGDHDRRIIGLGIQSGNSTG